MSRFTRSFEHLPRGVWALGAASLLMDVSSELVHSLLPVFLTASLGMSVAMVGMIEGIAEATASITKLFSGALSDRIGRRKPLVLLGYGFSALTKPLFPLASGVGLIVTARFVDRIGKGIRGAPRDALIADITPVELRGRAYGLRQALDSVGAFLGPLIALGLLAGLAWSVTAAFWIAVIPAALAVLAIAVFVREPEFVATPVRRVPLSRTELARLPAAFWRVVLFAGVLTLARFSDAFLVLRAQSVGTPVAWIPVVMIVMNVVYAGAAYPAGVAADRMSRRALLGWGVALLIAADVVLAFADALPVVMAGVVLWGFHMAITSGLLSALVADHAPPDLRGTAFGVFHLASGVFLLVASGLAGVLWSTLGPGATFAAGAVFTAIAGGGLIAGARRDRA